MVGSILDPRAGDAPVAAHLAVLDDAAALAEAKRAALAALLGLIRGSSGEAEAVARLDGQRKLVHAMRGGDEEVVELAGECIAALSAGAAAEGGSTSRDEEGSAVPGAAVGAAARRPPGLRLFTLPAPAAAAAAAATGPPPPLEVVVMESEWSGASLGWRVWGSALVLSRILLARPGLVAGRDVLELGSGCGLAGLLAWQLGARQVTLSDCTPGILRSLRRAARINRRRVAGAGAGAGAARGGVRVRLARWEKDAEALGVEVPAGDYLATPEEEGERAEPALGGRHFGVVIASDVLYEEAQAVSLACALAARLARPEEGGAPAIAAIVIPVRRWVVLRLFAHTCSGLGLRLHVAAAEGPAVEEKGWECPDPFPWAAEDEEGEGEAAGGEEGEEGEEGAGDRTSESSVTGAGCGGAAAAAAAAGGGGGGGGGAAGREAELASGEPPGDDELRGLEGGFAQLWVTW